MVFGRSFVGMKMSGNVAPTHLVRKLIASWLMSGAWLMPRWDCWTRTRGIHIAVPGVVVRGECLGVGRVWAGVIGAGSCCRAEGAHVIAGMLLGVLLCMCCKCIHLVNLRMQRAVGFGATIMGGASVNHWSAGTKSG